MNFKIFCILFIIPQTLFAQSPKINIGAHVNPILNYNQSKIADENSGLMKPFNVGSQIGVEVNYNLNNRIAIAPTLKYYRKSQYIEQSEFFGYLNEDSKTFLKSAYATIGLGLVAKYRFYANLRLAVGGIYSWANVTEIKSGYSLSGDNDKTIHLGAIGYSYTPDDFGTKINMFHPVLGLRNTGKINRIGLIDYGFLFYLPTRNMPRYKYEQILLTNDEGEIKSEVDYQSRQYSIEVSLIYYFINLKK